MDHDQTRLLIVPDGADDPSSRWQHSSSESNFPRRRTTRGPFGFIKNPLVLTNFSTNFNGDDYEDDQSDDKDTDSGYYPHTDAEEHVLERSRIREDLPKLMLHPDFDTSTSHLYKLFAVLDNNGDGELTYGQMKEGFEAMDAFPDFTTDQLDALIEAIDTDKSNTICLSEFVSAMHEYAAQSVSGGEDYTCLCFDYAPTFVKQLVILPDNPLRERPVWDRLCAGNPTNQLDTSRLTIDPATTNLSTFLKDHKERPADGRVRWLCFSGGNAAAFVRIANAFELHPLAIADVLEDRGRAKVDTFGKVVQIRLGTIKPKQNNPNRVRLHHMNIFLIDRHTVLTIEKNRSPFMDDLTGRIKYAGSRLRLNDASYLVHAIVDSAVDALVPVTTSYQRHLNTVYKTLHGKGTFSLEDVHATQQVYREVTKIIYWLRPLIRVVTQLTVNLAGEDKELVRYFDDLKDNIETVREHAKAMEKNAQSLNEDFVNYQQYKMNQ
eukprot:Ihof_evm14s5 gene=Ihof_evmTU14s5